MECRETGEFAHRESTIYEQLETFNDEVVNEVQGHEDYVHLKSLEDEFHFMDSDMPPRPDREGSGGGGAGGSSSQRPASPGADSKHHPADDPIYAQCDEEEGRADDKHSRWGG